MDADNTTKEDISLETDETLDDSVVAEESAAETIKKLREKLKKCSEEKQEYLTGWQKAQADFVNLRKRDEEDRKLFAKLAAANIIEDILPAIDSFDLAMANKEAWEKADKSWRQGIEYIYSQLLQSLQSHGLQQLTPKVGEKFDPAQHEAVETVAVETATQDHAIVAVMSKGYLLAGKLLRPAKVNVGEYKHVS